MLFVSSIRNYIYIYNDSYCLENIWRAHKHTHKQKKLFIHSVEPQIRQEIHNDLFEEVTDRVRARVCISASPQNKTYTEW